MADKTGKSEFVDTIGDATTQRYRRAMPRAKAPVVKAAPKMGHWPPERLEQWRLENLTPWKIKPWKIKDWV
ncbi:hypothetical protein [Bradyrhizobium sp.]|uniref:hypothetical protein n=1 Tax=Bradyrhizobium sp. TaxID=376 RepID=UPI00262B4AD2|nr:hypothetical protein [Bradyrhizobium sp.]